MKDDRRLFYSHVGAVVFTAAMVALLLLGVVFIPSWVSLACCFAIAAVATTFVTMAVINVRAINSGNVRQRVDYLLVPVALSMLQMIFVLPVLICVLAPTFRA